MALAFLIARGLWRIILVIGFHVLYKVTGRVNSGIGRLHTWTVIAEAWFWYMIARSAGDAIPPYKIAKRRAVLDKALALLEEE